MTLRGQFTKATAFALFMLVLPPEIGLSQQQPSIVISSPAAGHPVAPGATIVVNVVPSAGVSPVAMELFGDPLHSRLPRRFRVRFPSAGMKSPRPHFFRQGNPSTRTRWSST
jgi:hypothetical protein